GDAPPPRLETVYVGPGELPIGGPAAGSSRRSVQAPAEASAILSLQQREYEKQRAANEAAKKRAETRTRDPYLFPFEEYYFFDLTAEYNFFQQVDGARRMFNRTPPQQLTDNDLPPSAPWETQAFTSQSVPLQSFPAGEYELEVTVHDRLTRASAKQSIAFTV